MDSERIDDGMPVIRIQKAILVLNIIYTHMDSKGSTLEYQIYKIQKENQY